MFCGKCGARIPDVDRFCYKCGSAATAIAAAAETPSANAEPRVASFEQRASAEAQSRVVYVLLGLFLGGLGIHNFYAGYGGRGFIQLLLWAFGWAVFATWVILGIWIIVELLTVDRNANGVLFR